MTELWVGTAAFHATDVDSATTITDNKGNTFTRVGKSTVSGSVWSGLYYCGSPIVGTGHTFTYHVTTSSDLALSVLGDDLLTAPTVDQGSNSTFSSSSGASVTTPQITTTAASEVLVSVYTNDDGNDTVTVSNGGSSSATWAKDSEQTGNAGIRITLGHAVVAATGTYSATWATTGATTVCPRGIASSKAGGGGGFDPSTVPWSVPAPDTTAVVLIEF